MATKSIKPVNGACPEGYVWDSDSNSCIPTSYKYTASNLGEAKWSSQQSDDDYISELIKVGVSEEDAKKRLQEKKKIQLETRNKIFAKGGDDAVKLLDLVNSGVDLTKHQDLIERVTKTTGINKSFPDNEDIFGFISIADNVSMASNPEYYKKKAEERQLLESQQIPEKRKKFEQDLRDAGADQEEIDYELKMYDNGNKGIGFTEYKAQQQQAPVSKLVTPPVTTQVQATIPQTQTEPVVDNRLMPGGAADGTGMNQITPVQNSALQDIIASAQPTPVINIQTPTLTPQTPQPYGVQEDPFAGVGAQPIQERTMPDTDKPSLFQGLRNLIGNLFQGGKATTPEQPVNVQAPPAQQGLSDADINARMAQMGAVSDNVAPGIYTDPNVINAQNVAANAVTGATPVTANVAPEQTGMFGGGQSGAGSMAQSELGGLSGGTAMPATEGQPTDVAVAEANTGTIPASVVKPVTTTPVTYPGTQTAVTPQASGNLPINFSFEEDLTAKGKQAGGDVQSQALMEMAQQAIQRGDYGGAEAMLRRPLTNQDFFAGPGMRESRTAWGDPIFTGEGQLFPMAVLDARQKAQAQVRNMAIEDDVLNMTIPTVNVAGLRENYSRDFVADSEAFMRDGIKRYGSAGNAIKAMKKSGEWAKHMSKWKATAESINTTGKMATDFLTKAKEGMQKGDTFASPEALASATMFLNGLEEFSQGNIGPERLAQLQNMFYTTESWSKYLNENKDKVKPIEFTPDFKALDTAENRAAYEAFVQEIPVDRRPGYNDWLVTTKIAEVAKPQAISTLIEPFLRSNPTALEQFRLMYPGKKDKEIIDALGNSVAQMYGRQLTTSMVGESPQSNTNININSGRGPKEGADYFQKINATQADVLSGINGFVQTLNAEKKKGADRAGLLKKSVKGLFRKYSEKGEVTPSYVGYEPITVSGFTLDETPKTPESYKKFDAKTGRFVPMVLGTGPDFQGDFPGLVAGQAIESNPVINKLEVVAMTPDGQTFAWDSENIPANAELYVVKQMTLDYKKPANDIRGGKVPGKTIQVYDVSPLSQSGEQLDAILQKQYRTSVAEGEDQKPFEFGK